MQLMADPLFEVANHSWTDRNLRTASPEIVEQQVIWTQAEYEFLRERLLARPCAAGLAGEAAKIPSAPLAFRFPFGVCSPEAMRFVNGRGLYAVQWDVVTGDPATGQTALAIARVVRTQVRPGSIIIGHANGRGHGTAESLPIIVPELRAYGYEFVTVSELIRGGRPRAAGECFEIHPGDNKQYDYTEDD
jgi:peptidoglycan/xylan/chitin deacetylase (PgdA/CDA1 family)